MKPGHLFRVTEILLAVEWPVLQQQLQCSLAQALSPMFLAVLGAAGQSHCSARRSFSPNRHDPDHTAGLPPAPPTAHAELPLSIMRASP